MFVCKKFVILLSCLLPCNLIDNFVVNYAAGNDFAAEIR